MKSKMKEIRRPKSSRSTEKENPVFHLKLEDRLLCIKVEDPQDQLIS